MNEFRFGVADERNEVIFANDLKTAVRYFYSRVSNPEVCVPDRYIRTDGNGNWIGTLHDHLGFLPEYRADACIPVFLRIGDSWTEVATIPLSTALGIIRANIDGAPKLPGGSAGQTP
jgi:hypothetical protein